MRRTITLMVVAVTLGVSLVLLISASRCVNANAYHLPQPGVLACHTHQPVNHVPLWRIVTTSLLPSGLLAFSWWLMRAAFGSTVRGVLPYLLATTAWRATLRSRTRDRPPNFLTASFADGLAGGQVIFG